MLGLIGGTGLGEALVGETGGESRRIETPFGDPSGPILLANVEGLDVAILQRHGPGHIHGPTQVPYRANMYALKSLGVTHIIASGAVGSLREEIPPRDLVVVDQVIDKTVRRASSFFERGLVAHVEFSHPFCEVLRNKILTQADTVEAKVHPRGTYVCMEGPAFSSRAESRLHQSWGADLIGMTVMPEAKLAREAEISYAMIALSTDYDCWKPHPTGTTPQSLLEEIIGHLQSATSNAIALIRATIRALASEGLPPSPVHTALDLAVWTKPDAIAEGTLETYGVLVKRWRAARDAS